MNFLFSPLYSCLISPYRMRGNRFESSYEINRLWGNLPNRYVREIPVKSVAKMGVNVPLNNNSESQQTVLLTSSRMEKVVGGTIFPGPIMVNTTWDEAVSMKKLWARVTLSEELMEEMLIYVGEAIEYMVERGVRFRRKPRSL